ncbi:hypothetical protein [Haematomicrobium sanguinis]|uniref:hypothetical protein n=1 Tax=Haematomicrobium sanguinis TaxID=479106 RepID=UPI000AC19052|nr:hypothetical protein [Haematomicrobium sanguinis]
MADSELVLIGRRSSVGKSAEAFALHEILNDRFMPLVVMEGDALDTAFPSPWQHSLAERNLAAITASWGTEG